MKRDEHIYQKKLISIYQHKYTHRYFCINMYKMHKYADLSMSDNLKYAGKV